MLTTSFLDVWPMIVAGGFVVGFLVGMTGVGAGSLAAHRQSAQVADAAITFDGLEPLEIEAEFTAEVALDHILAVLDGVNDLRELGLGQILSADGRVDLRMSEDIDGVGGADAVDITQSDVDAFVRRDFYTNDTCHSRLTLTLLVTAVAANDADDALASHDFAIFAELLNGCANFHFRFVL